jgi:hypothetical protein
MNRNFFWQPAYGIDRGQTNNPPHPASIRYLYPFVIVSARSFRLGGITMPYQIIYLEDINSIQTTYSGLMKL